MRKHSRSTGAVAAVAALLVATAACSSDDDTAGGGDADDGAVDQVTYMTSFGNFGRDAYAWVALEQGYFEEEGIEVEIQPGQGGENLAMLSGGQAQFAVADITSVMFAASEDEDIDVTIVAAIYQNTITGLMALEESGITTPADLEGVTIGDAPGSVNVVLFDTYATLAGIDADSVSWENAAPPDLPQILAAGSVDVIGQFAVGQPLIELAAGGSPAVYLPYSEFLTDLYGVVLYTATETAEENPDLVQRFQSALLRGLEYAIENPEETGEILAMHDEQANPDIAAAEMTLLEPFVRPQSPGDPLGVIDEERVARSIALLEGAGSIVEGLTPSDLVSFDLVPGADN